MLVYCITIMTTNNLKALFSSNKDFWETPQKLFNQLDEIFHFELDAAANKENTKCPRFITHEQNSLIQPWAKMANVIYLNPPYTGTMRTWMMKVVKEAEQGATIVCLIAARLESKWFKLAWDYGRYIIFPYGRLDFELNGIPVKRTTFASAIVVFSNKEWDLTTMTPYGKVLNLYY